MQLLLPSINNLRSMIEVDPGQMIYTSKRYYSGFFRIPYLARLKMVVKLLGNCRYEKLLDLGLGSGFFMPQLSLHCDNLYGIDIHKNVFLVKEMLNKENIEANILVSDISGLPFKDDSFDGIVCLSVLEFVDDTDKAISEIGRIAKKNADIIIGAPVINKLTDFCYDWLAKSRYHRLLHKSTHKKILDSVDKYLRIERIVNYPLFTPRNLSLFFVLKAKKRGER